MGCFCSKVQKEELPNIVYTPFNSYSISALTANEKQILRESLVLMEGTDNFKEIGQKFFLLLFEKHPYMKNYFPQFKGKGVDAIKGTPSLGAHSISVFFSLSSCLASMDDEEQFNIVVQKIASRHFARSITVAEIKILKEVFLSFIEQPIGGKSIPGIVKAWDKFFNCFADLYDNACEELFLVGFRPLKKKTSGSDGVSDDSSSQGSTVAYA